MRTQMRNMKRRVQRGFTLVELAIVLVIAGLILVAVLRGTDAIQKAQVERMVSDLRGMQAILLEFQKRTGRLPGDCNMNGVLGNATQTPKNPTLLGTWGAAAGTALILDFDQANRVLPAPAVDTGGTGGNSARGVCMTGASEEAHVNLVWNELRRSGAVDANRLPRELARHSMGDVFLVSTMFDGTAAAPTATAGVIVVYGIPIWMAEAVDASIDGAATLYGPAGTVGPANTGRVRLWARTAGDTAAVAADNVFAAAAVANATYAYATGQDRDTLISISFQYTPNKLFR